MKTFLSPPPPAPIPPEPLGLTQAEYEFLLEDIEQAIEEGNRRYGYGGARYLGDDGNYYLFNPNDKYVDHTKKRHHRRKVARFNTNTEAKAVERSELKTETETETKVNGRDLFLSRIHKKLEAADPAARSKFAHMVYGVTYGYVQKNECSV